jgi:cell division protein FtsB
MENLKQSYEELEALVEKQKSQIDELGKDKRKKEREISRLQRGTCMGRPGHKYQCQL